MNYRKNSIIIGLLIFWKLYRLDRFVLQSQLTTVWKSFCCWLCLRKNNLTDKSVWKFILFSLPQTIYFHSHIDKIKTRFRNLMVKIYFKSYFQAITGQKVLKVFARSPGMIAIWFLLCRNKHWHPVT